MNPGGSSSTVIADSRQALPDVAQHWAADGPTLFARYAYPPNELGYCGPDDHVALLQYAAAGVVDPGLGQLAQAFEGAWPYLELIATETGIGHALDRRVVEAYWLGSPLLSRIDMQRFGNSLLARFRSRAGGGWGYLAEAIPAGALPTHSFHVLGIYPWVGLLRGERSEQPLHVLDRCRVRWGKVLSLHGDQAVVASQPLTWDGSRLGLGAYTPETVTRAVSGVGLRGDLEAGDWVSMHWGWICDRLSRRQLANLRQYTMLQLRVTNDGVSRPLAAVVLS